VPRAPPPRPSVAFSSAAAAGVAPAPTTRLTAAQVKNIKRHSTPMNVVSSATKPVSLLSPAALAGMCWRALCDAVVRHAVQCIVLRCDGRGDVCVLDGVCSGARRAK
jgi:hypothetical protein